MSPVSESQIQLARLFHNLHRKGEPLSLFNIWDSGSAQSVAKAGAVALATGSWSVAAANGYADGEQLPLELALSNLRRIVAMVNLPVSIDLETGYGITPAAISETIASAIAAGAIGCNLEDWHLAENRFYTIVEQSARIQAARQMADSLQIPFFINARTDIFLKADPATHTHGHLADALQRAKAYAAAGADGFFVPLLVEEGMIELLCEASHIPINIMMVSGCPSVMRLAELGVARISYGGAPYLATMKSLENAARIALLGANSITR